VASGSGTIHSSPPISPLAIAPVPRTLRDITEAAFSTPHAQATPVPDTIHTSLAPEFSLASMGIPPSQVIPATPDIISGSPTPDISLEIAGITSSQIVPATPDVVSSPPSPDIPPASAGIPTPQIVPVTPDPPVIHAKLKGKSSDSSSVTELSSSPEQVGPAAKKTRGRTAYK